MDRKLRTRGTRHPRWIFLSDGLFPVFVGVGIALLLDSPFLSQPWIWFVAAGVMLIVSFLGRIEGLRFPRLSVRKQKHKGERSWGNKEKAVNLITATPYMHSLLVRHDESKVELSTYLAHLLTGTKLAVQHKAEELASALLDEFVEEHPECAKDNKYNLTDLRRWIKRKSLEQARNIS